MADQVEKKESRPSSAASKKSVTADDQPEQSGLHDVVSAVTTKALQDFDTGDMEPVENPPPAENAPAPEETPGSPQGEEAAPQSEEAVPEADGEPEQVASSPKPGSAAGSRPPSGKLGSRSGSRAGSRAGSRPTSATNVDRPPSRPKSSKSQEERPPSAKSQRPPSATSQADRPRSSTSQAGRPRSSTSQADRPRSSTSQADRPSSTTLQADRPASATLQEDRPPSATSQADRPPSENGGQDSIGGSPKPQSRSGSVISQQSDRLGSEKSLGSDRPGSRPMSGQRGSLRGSLADNQTNDEQAGSTIVTARDSHLGGVEQEDPQYEPEYTADNEPEMNIDNLPQEDTAVPAAQDYGYYGGGGGGNDDGGDGGDSGDEYEEEGDEEEEALSGDEETDEEGDMVVLDPDHPLMKRFQTALKSQLSKQLEKVRLEYKELDHALKSKKQVREDLGVELYGLQQELARHQMMLEQNHDEFANVNQDRKRTEQELTEVRDFYKSSQLTANQEKKKSSELQSEVENLALRLFYMDNAKEDVRSDIAVMRRAAEKADTEVAKAEADKQSQDLFVDRLVERVDKLKEEIAMYDAQITAQEEETRSAKDALNEARMEIEGITVEKKQLFNQWNSSLIGMRRRDEAHAAMMEALNQQQQKILSLETEIEGYKKSITKEQEQNEKLTLILNKTEMDIATVKKLLAQCMAKHEALKAEYATYTRMLHETEAALNRALTDKTLRTNEVNALRKQIEREYLEKVELEDEIMEKIRGQLTLDKAAQYTEKLTGNLRDRTKSLEAQEAQVENAIARDSLEISNTKTRIERLQTVIKELDGGIMKKNEIIDRSEREIVKRNAVIERKQGVIDQYNKRLEQMIHAAGGVELGPLEITINSLLKSIEGQMNDIADLQQMWLRSQSELVQLSKNKDQEGRDVESLKKQLTIRSQKKLRIEYEIEQQKTEIHSIQRNVSNMQNDMLKLNQLFHKETNTREGLEKDNVLIENDFIGSLREAERDSIQEQGRLESLKEEKERLLNSLVEAERQIMLWEKKIQLAQETRAAVDSEIGQGEIRAMRAEIHRMTVRYAQLMKQQEKMIQDMEKAVSRRDTIVTRGDAVMKQTKKAITKGTFQRQLAEMRKKIKTTIQDANNADGEIQDMRQDQKELSEQLEDKQMNCQQLESSADTLDGDIERLLEQKQKNMGDLLAKQQKTKYFQQAKDGRYTRICRSDANLEGELQKQIDRMQSLSVIVDKLNQEFPHAQPAMRKVTISLSARV